MKKIHLVIISWVVSIVTGVICSITIAPIYAIVMCGLSTFGAIIITGATISDHWENLR